MSLEAASRVAGVGTSLSQTPASILPSDLERFFGEPRSRTSLLAVSSAREEHRFLEQTFRGTCWKLHEAESYGAALMTLCRERIRVVICQCSLPDGDWRDVLGQTAILPDAPRLIVTSPEPDDRLWAEVFNMGGYDVLTTPFDKSEVMWAVVAAWQSWETEWSRVKRARAKPNVFVLQA